ncbi:MAG: anti-sigma regulatory factor [Gammaproteobacteria bacterium]|nr:anti-sigma regulatory factor [Gammaproteobacteria bacterium]
MSNEIRVAIQTDVDIVTARMQGRALGTEVGFGSTDLTLIATAISELARNIILYAKQGEIILEVIANSDPCGITVVAQDQGPGIIDIGQAMRVGYSTSGSLGLGLPGVSRLMDEFHINSQPGQGTTVTVKKWKR